MAKVPNDVKNDKNFNRLRRVHERYKRQTDGRAIAYSECEREFTFAKNCDDTMCALSVYLHYSLHTFLQTSPIIHYRFRQRHVLKLLGVSS